MVVPKLSRIRLGASPARGSTLLLAAVVATMLVLPSGARMDGVSGRAEGGCTCHGGGVAWDGVAGNLAVAALLEGVPEAYEPGQVFALSISVEGGPPYLGAGFNLNASAGTLSVPGDEANVQITTADSFGGVAGEATHRTPDSKSWRVDWMAPPAGAGEVRFYLAVNSVNSNSQPDQADLWNLAAATSQEINVAPGAPVLEAAVAGVGAINATWAPAETDIVEFQVHGSRQAGFEPGDDTVLASAGPEATGVQVEGLQPGATYHLLLRVVDSGGLSADSAAVRVALPAVNNTVDAVGEPSKAGRAVPGPGVILALGALAAATRGRRR